MTGKGLQMPRKGISEEDWEGEEDKEEKQRDKPYFSKHSLYSSTDLKS